MSGTLADHPGRYANRANEPTNLEELGRAPNHLSEAQQKIWREIVASTQEGWLKRSDRIAVEACVRLTEQLRAGTISNQGMSVLSTLLAKLGFTPADRSKVQVSPQKLKEDANPFAKLLAEDDEERVTQ
jgi:phage terminase small subunit